MKLFDRDTAFPDKAKWVNRISLMPLIPLARHTVTQAWSSTAVLVRSAIFTKNIASAEVSVLDLLWIVLLTSRFSKCKVNRELSQQYVSGSRTNTSLS